MTMLPGLLGALAVGAVAGAIHFWLLWRTVRAMRDARRPWLLMGGSFLARVSLLLGAFLLVAFNSWPRLLAALLGFLFARLLITRRVHRGEPARPEQGDGDHA